MTISLSIVMGIFEVQIVVNYVIFMENKHWKYSIRSELECWFASKESCRSLHQHRLGDVCCQLKRLDP